MKKACHSEQSEESKYFYRTPVTVFEYIIKIKYVYFIHPLVFKLAFTDYFIILFNQKSA